MSISKSRVFPLIALTALVALAGTGIGAAALDHTQPENADRRPGGAPDVGAMLVRGLDRSPGCLKVITASTSAGTSTIIAWFENKAAVEEWYYSNTHTRVMGMVGTDPDDKKPMAHVEDENIPVMVMASITLAEKGVLPGPMPVSQISIELYTPLDAGASVNGRLMPEEIKLEHFNAISIDADAQPDG